VALEEAERLADRSLRGWIDGGRAVAVMVGLSAGDDVLMKAFGSSGTGARPRPGYHGHILVLVVGRPYQELVVERVCAPLGLNDTGPMPAAGRAARGHCRGGRLAPPLPIPTLGGAGVLRSTVDDMLAYLRAHLHPGANPAPRGRTPAISSGRAGLASALLEALAD
jgi:hypothetical protein